MLLPDGTVLPTYIAPGEPIDGGAWSAMSDVVLRFGEVVEAFPPDDPQNKLRPPNQWEYIVNVWYRNSTGAFFVTPYRCTVAEGFGSLADHVRFSLRRTNAVGEVGGEPTKGATVLILCPNGDRSDALIVGARRNRKDEVAKDPSTHFFDFEFNGVHASVDADGQLKVEVPGATDIDGKPYANRSASNKGSQVTFAKDGTITVSDQNGQSIVISPSIKKVKVYGKDVTVYSDDIQLGEDDLTPQENGVVFGGGVDIFTGMTYYELQNASNKVKIKK